MGEGDCVDTEGRRLAGLQKLGLCFLHEQQLE